MQAELAKAGLTREYRIKRLKDCIDSREGVIKGLDMSFKLANEYPHEQQGEGDKHFHLHLENQRQEYEGI